MSLLKLKTFGQRRPTCEPLPCPLAADGGALAARLVRGYEAQGAGWMWETDRDGRITYMSEKVSAQIGDGRPVVGRTITELFEAGVVDAGERTLAFHFNARASFSDYEVRSTVSGAERSWSISGRPWFDELDQFRGFVGSGCDLTDKRRSEAEISRLAMYDSLTGLANRVHMRRALSQALGGAQKSRQPPALMLLDLDRFKTVNDTLGHQVGDELLKQVAERLKRSIGGDGLVGRLGGDEFMLLLPGRQDKELASVADALIASLSRPYPINDTQVVIGCSVGIAIASAAGSDPEVLVRNADIALYAAKANGRGMHRFFEDAMLVEAQTRKLMEDDLRFALARDQLHLVYQPVVSTRHGQIVGYEALIRWLHPERGAISPADFIPVAEESGLIDAIGQWVMQSACEVAATLPASVRMAVNVSPVQFAKRSFTGIVMNALASSGLSPDRLELEITESVFLDGSISTEQTFRALKGIGVRLALDDFGTGYSSLGYLRTAPFDKIKIDQSFVRGAKIAGNRNAAIIKAIVTLADTLGLETTAEGVEAQDEIELIRELGCSHIQGYVYGRPQSADLLARGDLALSAATPVGVRQTRSPRTKMLLSVTMCDGDRKGAARVRNISNTGAMIDSVSGMVLTHESEVRICLFGVSRAARLRWMRNGQAGLVFHTPIDLEAALLDPIGRNPHPIRRTSVRAANA